MVFKFSLLFILFFSLQAFANSKGDVAYAIKANYLDAHQKIIYVEDQVLKKNDRGECLFIKTTYSRPNGEIIATLTSDFSNDLFIPESEFIDFRFKQKQLVHLNLQTKEITLKLVDLKTGVIKEKTIKQVDGMVSGQGFNNYILNHFNEQSADIKFIVTSKLDYFNFKLNALPGDSPDERKFVLKLSNWFLRALVDKMTVDYRIKDKVLLRFSGLTNVETDDHNSQVLSVNFKVPPLAIQ